MLVSKMNWRKV